MKLDVTHTDKAVSASEPSANSDLASGEPSSGSERVDETQLNSKLEESSLTEKAKTVKKKSQELRPNRVRQYRIESMMSKAELARRANLSVLTIDRLEKGFGCRMHTKRKILEALGLSLADRVRVFGEEEE
ncbi:MAG: helix-turn-helix transcriptional regulator [Deltaproteobacteria bacterium]|nr:helix-turn-helix transcriptional regulator [Deltaproteobacteria bacterium]